MAVPPAQRWEIPKKGISESPSSSVFFTTDHDFQVGLSSSGEFRTITDESEVNFNIQGTKSTQRAMTSSASDITQQVWPSINYRKEKF